MTRARELANFADNTAGLETLTVSDITDLTATASELNKLDGVTVSTGNINSAINQITDSSTDLNVDSNTLVVDKSANSVGIGATSPTSVLTVKSDATNDMANGIRLEANGSTNTPVLMYENNTAEGVFELYDDATRNVRLMANGSSYFNGGNFGINDDSPSYKLDITGPGTSDGSTLRLNDSVSSANSKHLLLTRGASTASIGIAGSQTNDPLWISRSGGYDLIISSGGNIGIKQTGPASLLTIGSVNDNNSANTPLGKVGQDPAILINNSSHVNSESQLLFGYNSGSETYAPVVISYKNTSASSKGKGDLLFATRDATTDSAPTERMRIDSSGKVGIGQSSLDAQLTVKGDASTQGQGAIFFNRTGQTGMSIGLKPSSDDLVIGSSWNPASGTKMTITSSGNVGIGTSVTHASLNIHEPNSAPSIGTIAHSQLHLYNGTIVNDHSTLSFGYSNTNVTNTTAYISYVSTDQTSYGKGDLIFGTRNVTTDSAPTERMRIHSSGRFHVKTGPSITNNFSYSIWTETWDTPNGGEKTVQLLRDTLGTWLVVGKINDMDDLKGNMSSTNSFDTSTSQSTSTQWSSCFGDYYPSQVRVLGSSDWDYWRENRSVDWVWGVPNNRPWKQFFTSGNSSGMAHSGNNWSNNNRYGFETAGCYDGFGEWHNPFYVFMRMSDGQTTISDSFFTTNGSTMNWHTASDAKLSAHATAASSGQDADNHQSIGWDDGVFAFYRDYPDVTTNHSPDVGKSGGETPVWILLKVADHYSEN